MSAERVSTSPLVVLACHDSGSGMFGPASMSVLVEARLLIAALGSYRTSMATGRLRGHRHRPPSAQPGPALHPRQLQCDAPGNPRCSSNRTSSVHRRVRVSFCGPEPLVSVWPITTMPPPMGTWPQTAVAAVLVGAPERSPGGRSSYRGSRVRSCILRSGCQSQVGRRRECDWSAMC